MAALSLEILDQFLQFAFRLLFRLLGIIVLDQVDVGPEPVFVTDPVHQLEGLVAFKGIPGNANGAGTPLLTAKGFPGLLKVNL
jgi:hypothetical protein